MPQEQNNLATLSQDDLNVVWLENKSSIIKVIGVGGGGGNAVNYMYQQGIHNVNFVVCNTDAQDLQKSPVPVKVSLGALGAGGDPKVGHKAAMDHLDQIREVLDTGTEMVFITAGMGGGTGTGAAPVIARVAKELGILTVAIITIPFRHEGLKKYNYAMAGINELKEHVDSLLVIDNEKLLEMYGDMKLRDAFAKADNVLTMAAKGIAELVTVPGYINVDFADVSSTMTNGGITVMGSASASGPNRARDAVEAALNSPLLSNNDIKGARRILVNITSGTDEDEITMKEFGEISDYVTCSTKNATMKCGTALNKSMGDAVSVTIVATDFKNTECIDPTFEIFNTSDPDTETVDIEEKPKKVCYTSNEQASGNAQPAWSTKFEIREKKTAIQTEIKWDMAEVCVADVAPEPVESKRAVPFVVDENVSIDEMENTPAIHRKKKIILDNQLSGTVREVSKYTLSSDRENTVRLRDNNSYLHDVVD